MRGRDLLILAAVLLVGGFAVADTLRSEAESPPARTEAERPPTTSTTSVVTTAPEPENLGRETFPAVSGAGGSVVFTQPGSCAVREVDLPSGFEFPNAIARSSCELWAAPVTAKVAVGLGPPARDAVPFRFVDLARRGRNLGGSRAFFGFLIWSDDGQRAAWCTRPTRGFDLELGGDSNNLSECPAAYTPLGEVVFARGDSLVFEDGRTDLRASGQITLANYGRDGSTAVVVEGSRIERWREGRRRQALELPVRFHGDTPVFSPDNCAALFRAGETMRLVDVGCSPFRELTFPGTAAAWSPDGDWIALAGPAEVAFQHLAGRGETVTWPVGAVEITWRR
jgi:hypothetical protein